MCFHKVPSADAGHEQRLRRGQHGGDKPAVRTSAWTNLQFHTTSQCPSSTIWQRTKKLNRFSRMWKKTKTQKQCTYIFKWQAVIFVLPDALVLTSPLCFSTEVCLPGLFLLLRLELLLRPREVTGEVTADIWRGLSEPVSAFTIETQRMNAKSNLIVICDV